MAALYESQMPRGSRLRRPPVPCAWLLAIVAVLSPLTAEGRGREPIEVALDVAIARCPADRPNARPVRDSSWVEAHVAAANRVLRPHGVTLRSKVRHITPARCALRDRGDRNALATEARPGAVVTVFVVESVADLAVPGHALTGVTWPYRGKDARLRGRRYVILSAKSRRPFLAHEVAHYFGLNHDPAGGNLMTPGPSSPMWQREPKPKPFRPVLTDAQGRDLYKAVRALVGRGHRTKREPPSKPSEAPAGGEESGRTGEAP